MKKYVIVKRGLYFYKQDGTPFPPEEFKMAAFVALDLEDGTFNVLKDRTGTLSTQLVTDNEIFTEFI